MDKWLIKTKPQTNNISLSVTSTTEAVTNKTDVVLEDSESESEDNYSDDHTQEQEEEQDNCNLAPKSKKPWNPKIKPADVIKEFSWLDDTLDYPFCKICLTKISGGKFHLKRHESKSTHTRRARVAKMTPLVEMYLQKKDVKSLLIKKAELKMAAFLCVHNLPFLLLDYLPSLQKNIFPDSEICKSVQIKRKKATQLVVGTLAPHFQKELIQDLKNNVFSVIIDEMTDISIEKSLILIVRYWKNGCVKDRILDLIKVEDGTSEALFTSIIKLFHEHEIPYYNIIAFASDGASTMMGRVSGVQAKFKEVAPNIYVQVCLCHALHLCSSSATKKLPDVIEQFVRDIYSYFAHSSKRLSELAECQVFAEERPHKMLYASQTRWLSIKAVADRILDHWNSLILFFQRAVLEDNLPNARSILNALRNPVYKLYILFLSYVLDLIVKVNLEMQSETSKFPILLERMTLFYNVVMKNYIKRETLKSTSLHLINVSHPHNYLDLKSIYCGAKTEAFLQVESEKGSVSEKDAESFLKHVLAFYVELSTQIKNRFNFSDKYLIFASNFAPTVVKSQKIRSIATFVNLFPQVQCNIEDVNTEWQILNEQDLTNFSNDIAEFWCAVFKLKNTLNEPMFPNLSKVVQVILTLPHSSAAAERGFSQLSLNKSKFRNRLHIKTCAAILIVKDYIKNCTNNVNDWEPPLACSNYNESTLSSVSDEH
ncbi:zinc finger protein 862-like [Anoplophora glabripennis]|uniref:zinc finger protein 862-like n=1 Tax=Anoplophora glabripennis TaxID=217634 RepID=UPI000A12C97F|nr:zinc finger protein 862-like [Anoplophora glabripennis]